MNAETLFLENLALIDRVVAFVCRRNHYREDEAEDLSGYVRLRLIENDYAILRKFEGRSSFSTYLTTVIQRLAFQYRVQMWGKWRPSAEAQRLGDAGITLERLLTRDGLTLHEAIETLTARRDPPYSRKELEAVYARLPHRPAKPVLVPETDAAHAVASPESADAAVDREDRARTARVASTVIDLVMAGMGAEDQLILRLRFCSARRVPEIASALHLDQKKLYKRIDRLLLSLRRTLEDAGIEQSAIGDLIESGAVEIPEFGRSEQVENAPGREERVTR
jgi:RNA polymerase sigma factor for flagellar operon FliA